MNINKRKNMLSLLKEKILSERKAKEATSKLTRLYGECTHIPVQIHYGEIPCACCGEIIYNDDYAAYGEYKIDARVIDISGLSKEELYKRKLQIVQDLIIDTWSEAPVLTKQELMYEVERKIRKRYLKIPVNKGDNNEKL